MQMYMAAKVLGRGALGNKSLSKQKKEWEVKSIIEKKLNDEKKS